MNGFSCWSFLDVWWREHYVCTVWNASCALVLHFPPLRFWPVTFQSCIFNRLVRFGNDLITWVRGGATWVPVKHSLIHSSEWIHVVAKQFFDCDEISPSLRSVFGVHGGPKTANQFLLITTTNRTFFVQYYMYHYRATFEIIRWITCTPKIRHDKSCSSTIRYLT